jgi:hypothetical protein
MRDYCPSKQEQEKLKIKKTDKHSRAKRKSAKNSSVKDQSEKKSFLIILPIIFFVALIVMLIFFFLKKEINNLQQLKANRSVLLSDRGLPRAFLFFDVDDERLLVVDLKGFERDLDFDQEKFSQALLEEASLSSQLNQRIFYSFVLETVIDENFDYAITSLGKTELQAAFQDQKAYYHFLKNPELEWQFIDLNEQQITEISESLRREESFYNCPVAIVNTTDQSGLASKLASILQKASFLIIKRASNSDNLAETYFVYDPNLEDCQPLLDKLKNILPEKKMIADHQAAQAERAGLVIYIGQDLAELYFLFIDFFHGHL